MINLQQPEWKVAINTAFRPDMPLQVQRIMEYLTKKWEINNIHLLAKNKDNMENSDPNTQNRL